MVLARTPSSVASGPIVARHYGASILLSTGSRNGRLGYRAQIARRWHGRLCSDDELATLAMPASRKAKWLPRPHPVEVNPLNYSQKRRKGSTTGRLPVISGLWQQLSYISAGRPPRAVPRCLQHCLRGHRRREVPTQTGFSPGGQWDITGGTGPFGNASGSGTFDGRADITGPNGGVGHFTMIGMISSPDSLK